MVWGCRSANGYGKLHSWKQIWTVYIHLDILKSSLSEFATKVGLSGDWYFQEDNDPKQISHIVKEGLL